MSQQDVTTCPLHVSAETLSAWRSRLLDESELRRLDAHVPGCPSCQRTLAGFERIAQSLRALPEPPRRGLWEAIQDRIAQQAREGKRRRRARVRFVFDIAAIFVLLLIATLLFEELPFPRGHTETPTSTATATRPVPTATSWIPASADWVNSPKLLYGKSIAFAQSAPLTGYACGNPTTDPGDVTTPILFGVTHDGGQTWSPPTTTPALGVECHAYVNPHDAADVLLLTGGATPGYRTQNGGASWAKLNLPGGPNDFASSPVWIGSTLYVLEQTYVPTVTPAVGDGGGGPLPPMRIAVSQDGTNFGWLSDTTLYSAFTYTPNDHPTLGSPYAIGSRYYLGIYASGLTPNDTSCSNNVVCRIAWTGDNGATWSTITPTGAVPLYFQLGPDGKTLVGDNQNGNGAEISRDAGRTWTKLPAGAPGTFMEEPVRMTPDGTFYSIQTNVQGGPVNPSNPDVFKLAPGSDTWTPVASTQLEHYGILAVSWDEQGHPSALWALSGMNTGKQFAPGIAYHRA